MADRKAVAGHDHDDCDDIEKQSSPDHDLETASRFSNDEVDISGDQISHEDESDPAENTRKSTMGTLGRVLSRSTSKSSWNPGPPPDGGLRAWTAVLCAHLIIMNTWGYINSFSLFQAYYSTQLGLPPSTISWIGSTQVFLLFFIGTFSGRLTDAGYFRPIFLLGSFLQLLGVFTTAQSTEYWQLFLAQGICTGLGNGCLFCPAMAIVSTYFSKQRAMAIGIAACGSATGGLIFPAMARQLLPTVGFAWTIRAIGFVQFAALLIANLFLRTRVPPRKSGGLIDWAAFEELEYTFYAAGIFSCFLGVYFAFYYIASFARDIIGMSYTESLNLLLLLNGVGVFGRLGSNWAADRVGAINILIPVALAAAVCQLAWMAVKTTDGLYTWTVLYSLFAGGIQSLFPAGLASLTTDPSKAGVRMGMVFTIVSFAVLTGTPIGGALLSRESGQYWGAQTFAGIMLFLGGGFMIAVKWGRSRHQSGGWRTKV